MTTRHKLSRLLLTTVLLSTTVLSWWPGPTILAQVDEPPAPLPAECGGATGPGGTCCIFGYVYYDDTPITGVSVYIESPHGTLDATTTSGGASSDPYYSADLSAAPLLTSPGDTLTITVEYGGMISTRTWTAQDNGQQVDLGLVTGYQATEPIPALIPDPLGPATHAPNRPTTDVCGPISVDTTWDLSGSPYIATCGVLVEEGVTLTIDPGVEVRFDGLYFLQIDGQLIAQGTSDDPIIFTSNASTPNPGDWAYIYFTDTSVDATYDGEGNYLSGSIIQYAVVEYAGGVSGGYNAALRIDSSSPFVNRTTIRRNNSSGIAVFEGGSPKISYNVITDNSTSGDGGGIFIYYNDEVMVTVSHNIIIRNSATGNNGGGGGIYICYNAIATADHNVIADNSTSRGGGGICVHGSDSSVILAQNSILGNQAPNKGGGIYIWQPNPSGGVGNTDINSNTILYNASTDDGGVYLVVTTGSYHLDFRNNNLYDNADYDVYNAGTAYDPDVSAEDNWWGTTEQSQILAHIWDGYDDPALGLVDFTPYLTAPNTLAPVSPPTGLSAAAGSAINLSWSPNPESDAVGYQVYYDTDPGFPYAGTGAVEGVSPIDVGDVTSFTLTGLDTGTYYVTVTAYDTAADGADDQTDGNESWFAEEKQVQVQGPPQADFSGAPLSGTVPLAVTFTDLSTGSITTHSWDFGDGVTSTLQNPSHTYTRTGAFTVSLTVNGPGGSDTETKASYVTVNAVSPVANFDASPTSGIFPLAVDFSDTSTGDIDTWRWDFGDGVTSTLQNPSHTYTITGTFTVSLTVSGPGGDDTETKAGYITVSDYPAPDADFSAAPLSGTVPLTVTFTDQSTGDVTSWSWNFGDGGTSTLQKPLHTYTITGTFTISLTVNGPGGSDTETKVGYITVSDYPTPDADFSATPLAGTVPLTVTFTDQSTGDVTSWSWDFGDGGTSTDQDPIHAYTVSGTYTVSLTVSSPGGDDTETKVAYITVGHAAPNAAFTATPLVGTVPLTVTFTDQSVGAITTWDWTFGDGDVSAARHPAHVYESTGDYTVSLIVSGPGGSDVETKTNYITVNPPGSSPPTAAIDSITPNPAVQGQDLIYLNGSASDTDENGAYITAYVWISSLDGQLSAQEDFTVQASELSTGTHTIAFQAQDDEGEWSQEVTRTLTVQPPQADVRTLILVNRSKLESLYSSSEATQVMNELNTLAAHASVEGLVVQVENDAAVAAAYAAWDADPTDTSKANAVAEALKALIDTQWAAHPDLEYLVIVGDDRAVPFRRVLDQTRYPEGNYSLVSAASTTGAALHDDMSLTDDYYADATPTVPGSPGWDGHDLYIPDLGTGRLIETPSEIIAQIDTFLVDDGISVDNAIVTGYDFIKDGASAMCNELSDDGITTDCTLIGEHWDRDDFIAQVLDTRHDVVSINGHANHYVIGAPSGAHIYSSDVAGATADHTRAVFYTVGCHSGLNVPFTNPYEPLDTAQALVQHQANYIANTGYGWGYVTSIGLSEQLMLDFTERLVYGQSATLGQALAAAKQEYYLNDAHFDYYDEKIMIESALYGLPMVRYTTPTAMAAQMQEQSQEAMAITEEQLAVLGNGLTINSLSYQFPALIAESTDDGLYYVFGDLVHAGDGEPIQPKYTADLSFPGTEAHGVVLKGGVYTDVTSFNPVVDRAFTETVPLGEPTFSAPGWYPALPHRLNRLERGDRLVTLLGQFDSQSGSERIYDRLSFDVYYHTSSSDWTPPSITSISSDLAGGSALVNVEVEDSSGIETVVIAYTDGDGTWASVDLIDSGSLHIGSFPASANTEFFVQVVDKAGNVAVDNNNGKYFKPDDDSFTVYLPVVVKSR